MRHRGHPQLPRDEVAPSPSASSSPLDLDESDDEDVSRGRPHFDAAPGDEEDTDSALEEIEEADEANDEAPSAAATPKRSPKRSFLRCLDGLPPRWKNWFIRAFSGLLLIVGFTFLVSLGASGLLFLTYLVLTSCYSEVTRLAFKVTGAPRSVYRRFVWTLYCLAQVLGNMPVLNTCRLFLENCFNRMFAPSISVLLGRPRRPPTPEFLARFVRPVPRRRRGRLSPGEAPPGDLLRCVRGMPHVVRHALGRQLHQKVRGISFCYHLFRFCGNGHS